MAKLKNSMLVGAAESAPIQGTNNGKCEGTTCSYDGEAGYKKRVGGRIPEVNRVLSIGGRQLEKQTPPPSRKG